MKKRQVIAMKWNARARLNFCVVDLYAIRSYRNNLEIKQNRDATLPLSTKVAFIVELVRSHMMWLCRSLRFRFTVRTLDLWYLVVFFFFHFILRASTFVYYFVWYILNAIVVDIGCPAVLIPDHWKRILNL